jgi:CDP-glucose 4,6-dehydratase
MKRFADLLRSTYKNRKVLVTGHTGFKGSWLALWLKELDAEVMGFALNPRTERDNFVVSNVAKQIRDLRGDVRDFDALHSVFEDFKPEFVFHLAAQAIVREGYQTPKETFDTNVGGTVNVLENCRLSDSVRVIVNITSDKCYENKEWSWGYRECDPMGGYDPYSSSKGCAELVSSAYRNSFFNGESTPPSTRALSTVRAGNVIGGGDWAKDRIVPDCIRFLEAGQPIKVRNPYAIRPWQHVLEPLGGYLLLGAHMAKHGHQYSGPWNFGPDRSSTITVKELVELVITEWGSGSWESTATDNQAHEAGLLTLDINKARYHLGWSPCLNIKQTIERTVFWYRACNRGADMGNLTKQQIQDYMGHIVVS